MNRVLIGGGIGAIVALAFPVVSATSIFGTIQLPAMKSDLVLTAALGLVALLLGTRKSRGAHVLGGLLGLPVMALTINLLSNIGGVESDGLFSSIGPAVPITLISAGAMLVSLGFPAQAPAAESE